MLTSMGQKVGRYLVFIVTLIGLSGCGQRGDLYYPPQQQHPQQQSEVPTTVVSSVIQ